MTPKEKAKYLFDKYLKCMYYEDEFKIEYAKQCALIAVDEILEMKKEFWDDLQSEYFDWWKQVKNEIENL